MNTLDVRNSPEERILVEQSIKGHNRQKGSKYIRPTINVFGSYNDSRNPFLDPRNITMEDVEQAEEQVLINNQNKEEHDDNSQTDEQAAEFQADDNA